MQLRVPLFCGAIRLPVRHAIQVLEIMLEAYEPINIIIKMKLERNRIKFSTVHCDVNYIRII